MNKIKFILPCLCLIIGFFMINPAIEATTVNNETMSCYERYCSRFTLDEFDECIDLGWESVGFLSSEHYYLCDGIKVTNTCTERSERQVYEGSIFSYRCEQKSDANVATGEGVENGE